MPLRVGGATPPSIRLGPSQVTRAYLGGSLVYSSQPPAPPPPNPDLLPPIGVGIVRELLPTVSLAWTPRVVATGHVVQQSDDSGATWTVSAGTVSALSATITGLANGKTYLFRVASETAAGITPFSEPSSPFVPYGVPSVPAAVEAVGDSLRWTAPSDAGGASLSSLAYVIQRGTGTEPNVAWSVLDTVVGSTTYRIGVSCSLSYWYRVAARSPAGQSAYSAGVLVSAESSSQPPRDRSATAKVALDQCTDGLTVSWSGVANIPSSACDDATHFEIWAREKLSATDTACGSIAGMSLQATIPVDASVTRLDYVYSYDLLGLIAGKSYFVAVRPTNAAGAGVASCASVAVVRGGPEVPPRPSGVMVHNWGRASGFAWVPTLPYRREKAFWMGQNTTRLDLPFSESDINSSWKSHYCGDVFDVDTNCTIFGRADTPIRCLTGAYHTFPVSSSYGDEFFWRTRYSVNGVLGPWLYNIPNDLVPCTDSYNSIGGPFIHYVRGGKNAIRVQRGPADLYSWCTAIQSCSPTPCPRPVSGYLLEHRAASVGADGIVRGTGAWTPVEVGNDEGQSVAVPSGSVLEVRMRAENSSGIHAPGGPVAVRTWATGGTPSAGLNATGSMLYDDPTSWTQPKVDAPNTQMAAGRYLTVDRPCIVSLLPQVTSGGYAKARVLVGDSFGAPIGYIANKEEARHPFQGAMRLSFFAKPGRRYSVEIADDPASTNTISACYSEDIYDLVTMSNWRSIPRGVVTMADGRCFKHYPALVADLPGPLLIGSPAFNFSSSKDATAPEWLGPVTMTRAASGSGLNYFITAAISCEVRYKLTGCWSQWKGIPSQRKRYLLQEASITNIPRERLVPLARGECLTFEPGCHNSATLNWIFAVLAPSEDANIGGREFASRDNEGHMTIESKLDALNGM